MKKILVTGGAGYIGSHTCVELAGAGYHPVIIDDFSNSEEYMIDRINSLIDTPVSIHRGDCKDRDFLREVFRKEEEITGVIHFAAFKAVGESTSQPLKYYENNILSTLRLLEVMKEFQVLPLVFSSSCTVYGQPDKLPVTEDSPMKPAESPYGRTKQICEDMIFDFVRSGASLKSVALRYFNPIGAHPSSVIGELPKGVPNNLIPFVTQTAAGIREKLTIFGNDYDTPDGTCIRDYIHVVDLARAHVSAVRMLETLEDTNHYEALNVGSGEGHSVQEVVDLFEKVNHVDVNYEVGPRRPGDVVKTYADVSHSNKLLRWKTELSLADALRDAWNWQVALKNMNI